MRLRERSPSLWKQRGYIGVGNRRGMGGMTFRERIAAMIENADFRSELEYTAIPQRAASGTTASFTRATTKTWKNNDGYMVTGLAGEIDFPGARRVRNLIAGSTADLNNASWSKLNGATVAVDGRTVTFTANASSCIAQSYTFVAGNKYILQFKVSVPTTSKTFRLRADAVATQSSSELTATTTPTTVSFAFTAASSGAGAVYLINNAGATAGDIIVDESQFIDVTAETDQTTPREHVPVGVPSAWWGTERVSNGTFDTGYSGWTAVNAPTLTTDANGLKITNNGLSNGTVYQLLTGFTVGEKVVITGRLKSYGVPARVGFDAFSTGVPTASNGGVAALTADGTFQVEKTATETSMYLVLGNRNDSGGYNYFDNISVKPAVYFGSMVDGVRCYPTDINGVPLTTMERFKPETAAMNVAFKSNEFSTAPWATINTPSLTKNATGVDGATSAWTVTVSQGDEYNQLNGITLTAATYTRSIKIKKTTGAQSAYPIVLVNAPTTYLAAATIDTTAGVGTIWTAYSGWTIATSSVRVTSWNNDFWLVELTFLGTAAGWAVGYIGAMTTNATKASGSLADADVTSAAGTHVMQHLQIELGGKSSSYTDNTSAVAAATRDADILDYSSGDVPNIVWLAAGVKRESGVSGVGVIAELHDGTQNEDLYAYLTSATNIGFIGRDGGSTVLQSASVLSATNTYTPGTRAVVSLATSALAAEKKASDQGSTVTLGTASAGKGTVTKLRVGAYSTGAFQLQGNVGPLYGWTRVPSQSESNAVSTP